MGPSRTALPAEARGGPTARVLKTAGIVAAALFMVGLLPRAATAQVPDVPDAPDVPALPEPVDEAIYEAQSTVVPVLVDAAIALQPAATAVGFALRPGCAGAGSLLLIAAVAGAAALPVNPSFGLTPILILCGAAFDEGPADPVLVEVDEAAGPALEEALQPVLAEAEAGLEPARPSLSEACTGAALLGSTPRQVPPPLHRLNLVGLLCGG